QLAQLARQRNWGLSLLLVGWLHLLAFLSCHYLTIELRYLDAPGYVLIWSVELLGMWLIFLFCGGVRSAATPIQPLALLIRRMRTSMAHPRIAAPSEISQFTRNPSKGLRSAISRNVNSGGDFRSMEVFLRCTRRGKAAQIRRTRRPRAGLPVVHGRLVRLEE